MILVGLDGATWDLIEPWVEEGRLPTFRKLMESGCSGILQSTIPAMTPPAWASMVTGENPGKHGIFDFLYYDNEQSRLINSGMVKGERIWGILNHYGYKVVVVNVPIFYPPEKVDGAFISGMLTPSLDSSFTYPEGIKARLIEMGYEVETAPLRFSRFRELALSGKKEAVKTMVEQLNSSAGKKAEVTFWLTAIYDPEFIFVVFEGADRLQHYLWTDDMMFGIYDHYKKLDEILGKFLQRMGEDSTFIVVSDHGFSKIEQIFYLNNWLLDEGLVTLKHKSGIIQRVKFALFRPARKIATILGKLGFSTRQISRLASVAGGINFILRVDYEKTKAYCPTYTCMGIILNVKDGEEYEILRNSIVAKLNEIKDLNTGENVLTAYRGEEIYKGEHVKKAPDIVLSMEKGYALSEIMLAPSSKLRRKNFLLDVSEGMAFKTGDHVTDGMFLAYGSEIEKGKHIGEAAMVDIAPTILYLFDLPIPKDMDGMVIEEAFEEEILANRPIKYDSGISLGAKERIKIRRIKGLSSKSKYEVGEDCC